MNRLVLEVVAILGVAVVGATWILLVGSRGAVRPAAEVVAAATPATLAASRPGPVAPAKPGGPSPETRAYLDWLAPKGQLAAESLRAIGAQSDRVTQNPLLLRDEGWKVRTATAIEILRFTGQELQGYPLPVPQDALKLDAMNKQLGSDLVYVATELSAGVDQLNPARLKNAIDRIDAIKPKAQEATAEADALSRP